MKKNKIDWSNITVTLNGKPIEGITSVQFNSEIENVPTLESEAKRSLILYLKKEGIELIYGHGDYPVGISFEEKQCGIKTDPEYIGEMISKIHRDEWFKY